MHQRVSGRSVRGLEPHGQGPQAALGGSPEGLAALEEVLVEVEADIRLQALGESLQDLKRETGSEQTGGRVRRDVEEAAASTQVCVQGVEGFILVRIDGGGDAGSNWLDFQRNFIQLPLVFFPSSRNLSPPCLQ